ncbi:S-layer homology domain-containing protein [Paenibacillus sp. YN15]|uniref:S-layer homology domain-containing protein n=1 Tax=Paenibacillus sp. YN15 TaxID=1742774 RepID=UPI000DCE5772|nr:S-layer homology domain-containing protein [Paenibacillus sp. YN15]RAV01196.1 hypothetical protein DQG13_12485 [Paenibacillus sp. YN15]
MYKRVWSILMVWVLLAGSLFGLAPATYAAEGQETGAGEEAVPVYAEDFENGFGLFTSRFGTMQISANEKHSGQYGVQVGFNASAQGIWYKHDRLLEDWTVTAWVYDDMSEAINVLHFQETDTSTRNVNFWVGYNVTNQGESNYSTRFGNTHTPTTAARSQGWHKFTVVNDFTGEMELKVYVDDVLSMTGTAFKMRTVTMGNFWSDRNTSTTRYWDDFALYDVAIHMDGGEAPEEEAPVREPVTGKSGLGYKAETGISAIAHSLLLTAGSPDVIANDTKDMLDRTNPLIVPVLESGGALVPAELLADNYGAQLAWDDAGRTLAIGYEGHTGVLQPGASLMQVDGQPVSLAQPAAIRDGRLFIPLKEVAEALLNLQVAVKESGLMIVDAAAVEVTAAQEEQILQHFNRPGRILFVSTDGNDAGAGTLEAPYRTLEAARDRIRSMKAAEGLPEGGVTVYVRGGDYSRAEPFMLEEQDSGTEAAPVRYAGYFGEKARIHGGVIIPPGAFGAVAEQEIRDRFLPEAVEHIKVADLAALGVTAGQIGDIAYQGHGIVIQPSESELFVDNKPMIRARYPNQGYLKITEVIREGSVPRAGDMGGIPPIFKFKDPGSRVQSWSGVSDSWIYGFPKYQWADNTIGVHSIDPATLTMELAQPSYYGVGIGQGFYFFNVLEELDQPGEWYLDKQNLKAYVYAEENLDSVETAITLTDKELVDFRNVSHVIWENFDLAYTRKNAVNMTGGHHIRLEGNRIYNTGEKAIMAGNYPVADEYDVNSTDRGGRDYTIRSNDIFNIGKGAIHISGGDRQTLAPGSMLVENNHIWNYARLRMEDGIKMYGVGNTISHNKIHDAPKKAVQFGGNDMVVEYNEIYDVLYSVDDMGAVYMGRDLTYQGNVVRYNLFHNITGPGHSGLGVHAIYFDDFTSYGEVYGNLMYKVQNPIKYNGGSGHKTFNNIIYKATPNSGWYADVNNNSSNANFATGVLADNLARVPYQSAIWQAKYPHLAAFIASNPSVPRNNWFDSNAIIQHKSIGRYHPGYGGVVSNTYETQQDVGFLDEGSLNFNLRPDSAVYAEIPGFEPLPVDKMGLYADQYRTTTVQAALILASPATGGGGDGNSGGEDSGNGNGNGSSADGSGDSSAYSAGDADAAGTGVRITRLGQESQVAEVAITQASIQKAAAAGSPLQTVTVSFGEPASVNTVHIPLSAVELMRTHKLKLEVDFSHLRLDFPDSWFEQVRRSEAASNTGEGWVELKVELAGEKQGSLAPPGSGLSLQPVGSAVYLSWSIAENGSQRLLSGREFAIQGVWRYTAAGLQQLAVAPDSLAAVYTLAANSGGWRYVSGRSATQAEAISFNADSQGYYSLMVASPVFADISGHWASGAIGFMAVRTLMDGFADGSFRPEEGLTRAQLVTMLVKAWEFGPVAEEAASQVRYQDVKKNDWYAAYVETAAANGLIEGYPDGSFRPDAIVTRMEMSAILTRSAAALGKGLALNEGDGEELLRTYQDLADAPDWSRVYLAQAIGMKLLEGIGEETFGPELATTRAQAAMMLKRLIEQVEQGAH